MAILTVFRHVPPPILGSCGFIQDRTVEAFEEELDWIEACIQRGEQFGSRATDAAR